MRVKLKAFEEVPQGLGGKYGVRDHILLSGKIDKSA